MRLCAQLHVCVFKGKMRGMFTSLSHKMTMTSSEIKET